MNEWLVGPGKDPAVWAPPGYTLRAYLRDEGRGLLFDLGFVWQGYLSAGVLPRFSTVAKTFFNFDFARRCPNETRFTHGRREH